MYNIRPFEPTDMFSVIKLASDTLTEQYSPSLFNYFYETNNKGFIVAEMGHKIIGFIVGVKVNSEMAKILMLSVSKNFRRRNIGSMLLQEFIKQTLKDRTKIIELEVRVDNKKAIKFYKKHGFKITTKIREFYQNGESAYTMLKRLNV